MLKRSYFFNYRSTNFVTLTIWRWRKLEHHCSDKTAARSVPSCPNMLQTLVVVWEIPYSLILFIHLVTAPGIMSLPRGRSKYAPIVGTVPRPGFAGESLPPRPKYPLPRWPWCWGLPRPFIWEISVSNDSCANYVAKRGFYGRYICVLHSTLQSPHWILWQSFARCDYFAGQGLLLATRLG